MNSYFKRLIFLLIATSQTFAYADFNSGLDAASITIQYIMADPPLPSRHPDGKGLQFKLKPGYVTGDTEADYEYGGGAYSHQEGSISGYTFGAVSDYALTDNGSFFSWIVGAQVSGDFKTKQNGETSPSIFSRDAKAQVINLSFGWNQQFSRKDKDGYGFSMFAGPYIPIVHYQQNYENTQQSFKADLRSNETFFGVLVGAQWDFDLNENWGLQPFAILGDTFGSKDFFNPFGNTGECRSYDVSNVTSGDFNTVQIGEVDCGNRKEFLYDLMIGGIGLNLFYEPWGITTNLLTPFLNQLIFNVFYENEKPKLFYLSVSFSM